MQADSFELKREDYIACSIFLLATQGLFLGRIKIYAKKSRIHIRPFILS
jgi:hypothetical protein